MAAGILRAADRGRDDSDADNWAPYDASAAVRLTDTKESCLLCLATQILRAVLCLYARAFALSFGS